METKLPENGGEDIFILVEAEGLSLQDRFMRHWPRTKKEKIAKKLIREAIRARVKNFYRPKYDPSLTEDGSIQFVPGEQPAVGMSYNAWADIANKYKPERNSRLGTKLEYGAFLGVLIKKLVEEGNSIRWAWHAVCNNSEELGHYWDSEDAKLDFEPTGSRLVCGFYDLANADKILAQDEVEDGFWVASGSCFNFGCYYPIAHIVLFTVRYYTCKMSVGWIVLSDEAAA